MYGVVGDDIGISDSGSDEDVSGVESIYDAAGDGIGSG